jgi:SAM-dependent methyltransferase
MSSLSGTAAVLRLLRRIATDKQARSRAILALQTHDSLPPATCPCCGFVGRFTHHGGIGRQGVVCPQCRSVERHRLVTLAVQRGFIDLRGRRVLHFAPEPSIAALVRSMGPSEYRSADLEPGKADIVLNLEGLDLPDGSVDAVVVSHVLEHVDDRKALSELFRILVPGGQMIAMVPLIEGWSTTYEDPAVVSERDRAVHFGQRDHVRYYGADFRDRVRNAGFLLEEFTADGPDSVRYRLSRGQKVFVGRKPGA